jgi:hypothetical protein
MDRRKLVFSFTAIIFAVLILTLSGCETNLNDRLSKDDFLRNYSAGISVALTSSSPDFKSLYKSNPDITVNKCEVTFSNIYLSNNGINWQKIEEGAKDSFDLAKSSRFYVYPFVEGIEPDDYYKLRLGLKRIVFKSNYKSYTWEAETEDEVLYKDFDVYVTLFAKKRTGLLLFFDISSDFLNVDGGTFSLHAYKDYNLTMYFLPYSDKNIVVNGFWTTGDLHGYYKMSKGILMDTFMNYIGTFNIDTQTDSSGEFQILAGNFTGLKGEYQVISDLYSPDNEIVFFIGNNKVSGSWYKNYYGEWGTFYLDDTWPKSTSGTIYDSVGQEIGKITLGRKKFLEKVSGTYKMTATSYNGHVFTGETGNFILY